MRLAIINRFIITNLAAILLLGCSQVQAQTKVSVKTDPKTQTVSGTQREITENIIREYLLKNPAIIREALAVLQTREEKEKRTAFANNIKELKSQIYSDVDSPVAGNAKGDVAIVVFFDYFCGYCRKTLPDLKTVLANDSNIRVIYKELPIMGAPSQAASRAALAARRQGKYAEFHRALLETEGTDEATIKAISDRLGLNYEILKKDMGDPKISEVIERNLRLAAAIGVEGTPAYLVGDQFIPGAIDAVALAKLVAQERAKLGKPNGINKIAESKK